MQVFYWREKNRKSEYICKYLRESKILGGFLARAFQNFGDKKASKTIIFEIGESEEKKPMVRDMINTPFSSVGISSIFWFGVNKTLSPYLTRKF